MQSTARPKARGRRIPLWIAVAAVVHAEILLIIGILAYWLAPRDADLKARLGQLESIEIGTVDDEMARRILADLEREAEKVKAAETKKEIESITPPGQVVSIPRPIEEKRPDSARFASEYDATVDRETKRFGKMDEKAQAGAADGEASRAQRRVAAWEPAPPSQPVRPAAPMPVPTGAEGRRPSALAAPREGPSPASAPDGLLEPRIAKIEGGAGAPPSRSAFEGAPGLTPSREQIARAVGGGTQDALANVDEGETTSLNSKKWVFASFFNRIKEQVRQHWDPSSEYNKRDPTGAIYGRGDRYTLLRVRLKPDGSLAEVNVEKPSGMDFLDDTAVAAFRDAQPFPNPPRQLVQEGFVNFSFGFLLELSSTPRFRVFKFENQRP